MYLGPDEYIIFLERTDYYTRERIYEIMDKKSASANNSYTSYRYRAMQEAQNDLCNLFGHLFGHLVY